MIIRMTCSELAERFIKKILYNIFIAISNVWRSMSNVLKLFLPEKMNRVEALV